MRNRSVGVSLSQYVIVISLVCLGVFVAYSFLGEMITSMFGNYRTGYETMNKGIDDNIEKASYIKPGSLGGTPSTPVKKCDSSGCDIDFGDFVLNGIPDNFGSFINSTGAAGGTDQLADLLEQLAEQKDNPSTPVDEGKDFRDMANLGHLIGRMQEYYENSATNCASDADPKACYINKYTGSEHLPYISLNSELTTIIPGLTDTTSLTFNDVEQLTFISYAKQAQTDNPWYYNANKDKSPAIAMVEKFEKIKGDGSVSDNMKYVTEQIYRNLGTVSEKLLINSENVIVHTPNTSYYIDPVTGTNLDPISYSFTGTLDEVLHPQTSAASDLDSAIICATGSSSDTGQNCYNNNK